MNTFVNLESAAQFAFEKDSALSYNSLMSFVIWAGIPNSSNTFQIADLATIC